MLHIFLKYETGFMGIIGAHFHRLGQDVPLPLSLALILVYVLIPYLLGSINTAIIVSGKMYGDDVRTHGSGNAGFTNMMRNYGKKAALLTLVGDLVKTMLAVFIGWCTFGYLTAYIAGLACMIGHVFPVFYGFKGGKGVLCLAGILIMLDWRLFLILFAVFVIIVIGTKYISAGAVIGSMLFPLILNRMNDTGLRMIEFIALAMMLIVVLKHRENIKRIFKGTESKFEFKKSVKAEDRK